MLLYVICEGIQYEEKSWSKNQNVHMNVTTSWNILIWLQISCMIICLVDMYALIDMKYIKSCLKQCI